MSDLELLLARCGPFSEPSTYEQTGVHHGYRRFSLKGDHPFVGWCESGWVSWIEPGGFIVPHRDAGPYYRRFQLPVRTAGAMWTEDGYQEATVGVVFEVFHWLPHGVVNDTDEPRVHVVWDSDEPAGVESLGFEVFDIGLSDRIARSVDG